MADTSPDAKSGSTPADFVETSTYAEGTGAPGSSSNSSAAQNYSQNGTASSPSPTINAHLPSHSGHQKHPKKGGYFHPDPENALTPDPGTESLFEVDANRAFPYTPGHLTKLINPKNPHAFYALGGLKGLAKALHSDLKAGLSVDETSVPSDSINFQDVATAGTSKFGSFGNEIPANGLPRHTSEQSLDESTPASETNPESATDDKKSKKKSKEDKKKEKKSKTPKEAKIDLKALSTAAADKQQGHFRDRILTYCDNRLPDKKTKSILELAWQAYNDKVLILLTIAAVVSLALGLYETFDPNRDPSNPKVEWVEGVAIMVAIIVVVIVTTLNDWQMERQFNRLNKKNNDRNVKVIRSGVSREISVWDIVVGDVMHLETGDMIPVDGIFIEGHGVKCDESSATGESDLLKKVPGDYVYQVLDDMANGRPVEEESVDKLDPYIISGSKVSEGTGTFLVTAVGVNSSHGRTTMSLRTEQEDTPLQMKLNVLADWIAKFGGGAALLLFIVLFIKFCAHLPKNDGSASAKGQEFMEIFIVSVTVVVVAVPEGLPLAVTLALAFATTRMMKDNNLVRVLKACETMGNATTICTDKTGTLTQNKMTVVAAVLGNFVSFGGDGEILDQAHDEKPFVSPIPVVTCGEFVEKLGDGLKQDLIISNALNSTAFEGEQDGEDTYIGSKTEVALLTFCRSQLAAGPVDSVRTSCNVVQQVPFDSKYKCMATVIRMDNGKYRLFVKGASEILLGKCSSYVTDPTTASDHDSSALPVSTLTDEDRTMFGNIIQSYAGQTLRTIGSSYRDFEQWPPAHAASADDANMADFSLVHEDMTLLAIYGIKDPLRDGVPDAIKDCQHAGVVVRMVTGDNIVTARAIASECGIYHPKEGGIAMEGPEFRRLSPDQLRERVATLEVLARSSPEDKRILVRTLRELGETVAVTGDGTNDAPALKMADIGFSMGIAGTEVAKEASAIILMDDNFRSIVKGMMWGRAVNDSVKKFLQFQLTVNITAVVLTFVSAVASPDQESVLNAVQLLWVNLIMDTFAALALATDPPTRTVLDRKPERKSAPLITLNMAKMIFGQAICQLAITFVLHFGGKKLLGYNADETKVLNTLVFNTFVWLQIFNEVNNRRLDNRLNIFEAIHRNRFFIFMNLVMVGGQVLIIFKGGQAFKIAPLNGKEWGLSVGLGAISLPWGVLIRLTPDEWVKKLVPGFIRRRWLEAPEPAFSEDSSAAEKQATGDGEGVSANDSKAGQREFGMLKTHSTIRSKRSLNRPSFHDRLTETKLRMKQSFS